MTVLYPLGLRLAGRDAVVVGGGPVAARRAAGLVEAGALVVLIAPEPGPEAAALAATGAITLRRREYRAGDLAGAWLVHTATGVPEVDAAVLAEADASRTWCVVASDAQAATAWTPAVGRADGLTVAVHAGGDPRRAVAVRDAVLAALPGLDRPAVRAAQRGGRVALVGGGPGDPGLLTVRARRLLAEADVVVADRLGPRSALPDLAPDALVIDVGKLPGSHPVPQDEINALLVEHARAGRRVVRLKGGDPYVLGRGGEEAAHCRAAGVPVEVVPGVTSAISVPAAVGIPVTHRGVADAFTVRTGHQAVDAAPGGRDHTLVLLMGVATLARTAAALAAGERGDGCPVAVVQDGWGPRQRTVFGTLATIAAVVRDAGIRSPAVTVVGDVVLLSPLAPRSCAVQESRAPAAENS